MLKWCTYGVFGREITKYTVIYGVYIWYWPTLGIRNTLVKNVVGEECMVCSGDALLDARGCKTLCQRSDPLPIQASCAVLC
jgi:hypothetical protein